MAKYIVSLAITLLHILTIVNGTSIMKQILQLDLNDTILEQNDLFVRSITEECRQDLEIAQEGVRNKELWAIKCK